MTGKAEILSFSARSIFIIPDQLKCDSDSICSILFGQNNQRGATHPAEDYFVISNQLFYCDRFCD
jgi:hypothetical protein